MRAIAVCGYSNTEETAVWIEDIASFELAHLNWMTEGETPRTPGRHLCGRSGRHLNPSDVVLFVENEEGKIPHTGGTLEAVWDLFDDENKYRYDENDIYA